MSSKSPQKFKKIDEGSVEFEFAMNKFEKIQQVKLEIKDFITLNQSIED